MLVVFVFVPPMVFPAVVVGALKFLVLVGYKFVFHDDIPDFVIVEAYDVALVDLVDEYTSFVASSEMIAADKWIVAL